ncbi:MAG: hypothetical protein ABIH89_05820 [Elusimicrobiota bacterium]
MADMEKDEIFSKAIMNTAIMKMPNRKIATFGTTNMDYYLLSTRGEMIKIREGKVVSRRPEILGPVQIADLFEGFGDFAEKYPEELFEAFGKNIKILNYRFNNESGIVTEAKSTIMEVYEKINSELKKKQNNLAAIISGNDDTWQISVMKFIIDMTMKSAAENISELEEHGLFEDGGDIPGNIRNKIEYLFIKAKNDKMARSELGNMLNKHNLFNEYEDRFFRLFGQTRKYG